MAVMLLVPETKMAEVGKLINLGILLVRKVTWFVPTTTSATLILEPTAWQRLHLYTLIFQELILFHCDFQRQHSHSFCCDFHRQHSHSFYCDFHRQHSHSFHCDFQRQHSHSFHCDFLRQHSHSLFLLWLPETALFFSPLRLTETTQSLSYILTSSSQPHENVYILQPFSFLFYLFG